ncbi:MAG: hypothetical protein ACOCP8_03455 [archaeon]
MTATLFNPYNDYTRIKLIEKVGYKWLVEIIDCGKQIEVYDDEFVTD